MDDDEDRSDRQMTELLNELRVALPGVQILFAFLLTVPFAAGFRDVTSFQRDVVLRDAAQHRVRPRSA